ncbi:MAG: hypothetical protein ISP45_31325 [Reyranella sp.]|nr:hypothetical protein [Reyranella sp.]
MQSIIAAAVLILAIANPVEGKATANGNAVQPVAGFGLPRLPGLPHVPHVPKPRWP